MRKIVYIFISIILISILSLNLDAGVKKSYIKLYEVKSDERYPAKWVFMFTDEWKGNNYQCQPAFWKLECTVWG